MNLQISVHMFLSSAMAGRSFSNLRRWKY